jgi:hypothetical protein
MLEANSWRLVASDTLLAKLLAMVQVGVWAWRCRKPGNAEPEQSSLNYGACALTGVTRRSGPQRDRRLVGGRLIDFTVAGDTGNAKQKDKVGVRRGKERGKGSRRSL